MKQPIKLKAGELTIGHAEVTPAPMISFSVRESSVDLETGEVRIQWPSRDARNLQPIEELLRCEMAKAFICGYRAGCPDASAEEIAAAVIKWASH